MLLSRILTALIGLPIFLAAVIIGGWPSSLLVSLLVIVGLAEFYRMAVKTGVRPQRLLGYLGALGIVAAAATAGRAEGLWTAWMVVCFILLAGLVLHLIKPSPSLVASLGTTLLGALYVGGLFSFFIALRAESVLTLKAQPSLFLILTYGWWDRLAIGTRYVLLVLATTWGVDIVAYLVGRVIGRHALAPNVSPGKTIEGTIAGLIGGMLVSAAMGQWVDLELGQSLGLGLLLGVAGQLGDLAESALKRQAEVKDSGGLLPGHGGVLDRFDSLLFTAPLAYYYLRFFAFR